MRGVEEIQKGRDSNIYFSSLYHQNPTIGSGRNMNTNSNRSGSRGVTPIGDSNTNMGDYQDAGVTETSNGSTMSKSGTGIKRKRVNYNIQQIQAEQFLTSRPKAKSISEELEAELIDLTGKSSGGNISTISIAELRKAQRRFDELNRENYSENVRIEIPKNVTGLIVHRNTNAGAVVKRSLISKKGWSNFTDELNKNDLKLISNDGPLEVKPNALQFEKLCTICGGVSYSSCIKCGARVCSVKCQRIHNETRCTNF